jgi:hypothetical protein
MHSNIIMEINGRLIETYKLNRLLKKIKENHPIKKRGFGREPILYKDLNLILTGMPKNHKH